MTSCPCGSGADLEECCGPIIGGGRSAPTAEALMRSRYTAYVLGNMDHIDNTYAAEKRDPATSARNKNPFEAVEWLGLDIFDTTGGGVDDDTGTVHFAAHFREHGKSLVHRERSNFRRDGGNWVYVDGELNPKGETVRSTKIGRNQPCPCGSGKKYKKCCGA